MTPRALGSKSVKQKAPKPMSAIALCHELQVIPKGDPNASHLFPSTHSKSEYDESGCRSILDWIQELRGDGGKDWLDRLGKQKDFSDAESWAPEALVRLQELRTAVEHSNLLDALNAAMRLGSALPSEFSDKVCQAGGKRYSSHEARLPKSDRQRWLSAMVDFLVPDLQKEQENGKDKFTDKEIRDKIAARIGCDPVTVWCKMRSSMRKPRNRR